MQPLSVSPEIAVGPQEARPEVSGGARAIACNRSDNATPRTCRPGASAFHGPARRAGILGRDAR
jgi:hypothetical protein